MRIFHLARNLLLPLRRRSLPMARVSVAAGFRMRVDLRDRVIGTRLYQGRGYEEEFQRLIRRAVTPGSVCMDIGANIGLHTLGMGRAAGPHGRVFAIEPESRNFALLSENLRLNRIENVTLIRAAAGASPGRCWIKRSESNLGDHRVSSGPAPGSEEVPLVTVDEALRNTATGLVSFIKIDVQGYEPNVLRGMRATLQKNPNVVILMELAPQLLQDAGSSAAELLGLCQSVGLTGWEIDSYRIAPISPDWIYERIVREEEEYLILCRNAPILITLLEAHYGCEFPQRLIGGRDEGAVSGLESRPP